MSRASESLGIAMALLERLEPGAPERVQANLEAFSLETAELILGYALAEIVSRDGYVTSKTTPPRASYRYPRGVLAARRPGVPIQC